MSIHSKRKRWSKFAARSRRRTLGWILLSLMVWGIVVWTSAFAPMLQPGLATTVPASARPPATIQVAAKTPAPRSPSVTQLYSQARQSAQQGQYREAIASYEASLAQARREQHQYLPYILGNLAIAYRITGQYLNALETNQELIKLLEQEKQQVLLSKAWGNVGNLYLDLGDYAQAEDAFEQGKRLAIAQGDRSGETTLLNSMGTLESNQGKYKQAIALYKEALAIAQQTENLVQQGSIWLNLGVAHHAQGNFEQAQQNYQKSLDAAEQSENRKLQAEALGSLGVLHDSQGEFDQAVAFLRRSLAISQEMGDRPSESTTLNNLGHAFYAAGNFSKAEATLRQTLGVLDDLRQGLSDLGKVSLFDTQAKTYNLLQQVLIAQERPDQALEVAEWGRGRAFADLLLQRSGDTTRDNQTELVAQAAQPPKLEELKAVARSQQATLVEYTLVPQDDFVHQGKQLGIPADIFIWVIQPDGSVHHRQADLQPLIDQQQSLGNLVRLSRCFEADVLCRRRLRWPRSGSQVQPSQSQPVPKQTSPQEPAPEQPAPEQPSPENQSQISQRNFFALQELHRLLIDPIADLMPRSADERVLFIPQGSLFLVPFPALQSADGSFLIERHTLLTAPSIQALALTEKRTAQRRSSEQPSKADEILADEILIVGNPTMPAIALKPGQQPKPLAPLPGAESEAVAIAKTLGTTPLLGEAASETAVLKRLPQARWIHLATHGLLDYGLQTRQQTIPGAMALAPGELPDNTDGLLTAPEIIDLDLMADLVVLSACDTGRGDVTGDGVLGLTRAWMGAGAPSVVVSLWAVSDKSTAVLMEHFYANLNQGLDKATSLRNAILETATDYDNPFDWAAFNLVGLPDSSLTAGYTTTVHRQ